MKCDKKTMLLYAVTDRMWTGRQTLREQVEDALRGGVTCVQLREKDLDEESFLKEAIEMKELCHKYQVPFFINDNVTVAIRCGADGIHVGQEDMAAGTVRKYRIMAFLRSPPTVARYTATSARSRSPMGKRSRIPLMIGR